MRRFFDYAYPVIALGILVTSIFHTSTRLADETASRRALTDEVRALRAAVQRDVDAREALYLRLIERDIPDVPYPFFDDDPETDY